MPWGLNIENLWYLSFSLRAAINQFYDVAQRAVQSGSPPNPRFVAVMLYAHIEWPNLGQWR